MVGAAAGRLERALGLGPAVAAMLVGLLAAPAPAQSATPEPDVLTHRFASGTEAAAAARREATAPGWSRARMLAAEPRALPLGPPVGPPGASRSAASAAPPTASPSASVVGHPRRYPNRAHGRVFFRAGGIDFSCSGTVVSSGRGGLVNTAAHCLYDRAAGFVEDLVFVPGYRDGRAPFGRWRAVTGVVPGGWPLFGAAQLDLGFFQVARRNGRPLQRVVGSRGIGFGRRLGARVRAYGYPAAPAPFDGRYPVRCGGRTRPDPQHRGSLGMRCSMQFGASGGGWVAQDSFIVSTISHGHARGGRLYGPRFADQAKGLYRFSDPPAYPSARPIRCDGKPATIVGSSAAERIKGTRGRDVIATLGGNDRVIAGRGRDRICLGRGNDRVRAGKGRDRIRAGAGTDRCAGGPARDRARGCERGRI